MAADKFPKRKMQNVSFTSVDQVIDFIPEHELKIFEKLRGIVLECMPEANEHLAFNVPYYKLNRNVCFIWPASILWGSKQMYEGVRFGFTHGYLLQDEINFLNKEKRKQVYWHDFSDAKSVDAEILRPYIFEAILIDSHYGGKKK
jgi:hypothetical protein